MRYDYEKTPQGIIYDPDVNNINYIFLFKKISQTLAIKRQVDILEIGTGGGRNLKAISRKFKDKVRLYGTDISKTAIEYAKKQHIGTFYIARSEIIPIKKKFDLILIIDVLEHLETKNKVKETTENSLRYLKSGGFLYISVPIELNKFSLTWLFSKLPRCRDFTKIFFGHTLQFDKDEILSIFDKSKTSINDIFYSLHFLSQIQTLFFFFIPKVILYCFFGQRIADDLRDSNETLDGQKHPILGIFKKNYVGMGRKLGYLAFKESRIREHSSLSAGNMHIFIRGK